jgi:hypothetical protein
VENDSMIDDIEKEMKDNIKEIKELETIKKSDKSVKDNRKSQANAENVVSDELNKSAKLQALTH